MDSFRFEAAFGRCDNFKNLKYFGSRVWCRPPGYRDAKFKSNSRKGLFFGFLPDTTKIFLTTIENLIVSRKPVTSALTKASMISLYNNSLQMASTFGIRTMVLSFQLIHLSIVPQKILIFLLAVLLKPKHTTIILFVMIQFLVSN